jgi:hypothetical protein
MSTARVFQVHGNRFDGGVVPAGDVAEQPVESRKLPDLILRALCELVPATPEVKRCRDELISNRIEANRLAQELIDSEQVRMRADTEAAHELAKVAVVEQGAVLEKFKRTLAEGSQDTLRAQNLLRQAQTAAFNAEQELKSLSRFASQKEVDAVKRRVELANKKMEVAEAKAGELAQNLNFLKIVTIPGEQKKLAALIDKEMELDAQLKGRDPVMGSLGIFQR